MDEKGREQHLGDGNGVSSERATGHRENEINRQTGEGAPKENCRPDMPVRLTYPANPRPRRDPERGADAREPLTDHQPREKPVGATTNYLQAVAEQLRGAIRARIRGDYGLHF